MTIPLDGASLTERQVRDILSKLRKEHQTRLLKVRLRRALTFGRSDVSPVEMGTFVPAPFHKSKLIVKYVGADIFQAAMKKVALFTANRPNIQIPPIAGLKADVSERVRAIAAKEELALNGILYSADPMGLHQGRMSWAQCVDGVGAYITYPYEAGFGLPDRAYREDLTDDQIKRLKRGGKIVEKYNPKTGTDGYAESYDVWAERRREASKARGLNGESLYCLEVASGGEILWEMDKGGLRFLAVEQEVSIDDVAPGSESMVDYASRMGLKEEDLRRFGVYFHDGKIMAGIPQGGMPGDSRDRPNRVILTRLFTREDIYYLVSSSATRDDGVCVYWTQHGMDAVPATLAGGIPTHSDRPEEQFMPVLEALFKLEPLVNQTATMLSTIVGYNATGRWVAVSEKDNSFWPDPETGGTTPKVFHSTTAPGLDPATMEIFPPGYKPVQLTLDDSQLVKLLEFYMSQLEDAKPGEAETGEGALSGPAWSRQLAMAQAREVNAIPIQQHATAIRLLAKMWVRGLRKLGEPVHILTVPGRRLNASTAQALIEFDASKATDNILVRQSNMSQRDRIASEQHGLEMYKAGVISERTLHEEYREVDNPDAAVLESRLQKALLQVEPVIIEGVVGEVLGRLPGILAQTLPAVAERIAAERAAQRAALAQAQTAMAAGVAVPGTQGGGGVIQPELPQLPGGQPAPTPSVVA